MDYIWVRVTGGIMGFSREEIEAFERDYSTVKSFGADHWEYFNWYFMSDLSGKEATGYFRR